MNTTEAVKQLAFVVWDHIPLSERPAAREKLARIYGLLDSVTPEPVTPEPVTKPVTYRLLEAGETIEEGDEYKDWYHGWSPSRAAGATLEAGDVGTYRRPIRNVVTAPPEPQYRLLQAGETIEEGDEFLRPCGEWAPTIAAGLGLTIPHSDVSRYRRKLTLSDPVRSAVLFTGTVTL